VFALHQFHGVGDDTVKVANAPEVALATNVTEGISMFGFVYQCQILTFPAK
jgi:hypothetical protein